MSKKLYVGNLSWDTTEDSLRMTFEAGGRQVEEVALITDRETGRPRGFGFVTMSSDSEADEAINTLDGTELDGRNIRVNVALERQRGGGGGPSPGERLGG